jgi:hypothetical protein
MGFAADSEQGDQDVGHCSILCAANAMQIVCDQVVITDSDGQRSCSLARCKILGRFSGGAEMSLGEELSSSDTFERRAEHQGRNALSSGAAFVSAAAQKPTKPRSYLLCFAFGRQMQLGSIFRTLVSASPM